MIIRTQEKVTGLSFNLDPFQAVILQPSHTLISVAVPFLGPGRDSLLASHFLVELLTEQVSPLANNETTIVRTIGKKVHKSLETAEPRVIWILVLVGPGLVWRQILAVAEPVVDSVEGYDKIFSIIDLFKGTNNAGLGPDVPDEIFMRSSVVQEHALFIDDGKVVWVDGLAVASLVTFAAVSGWLAM